MRYIRSEVRRITVWVIVIVMSYAAFLAVVGAVLSIVMAPINIPDLYLMLDGFWINSITPLIVAAAVFVSVVHNFRSHGRRINRRWLAVKLFNELWILANLAWLTLFVVSFHGWLVGFSFIDPNELKLFAAAQWGNLAATMLLALCALAGGAIVVCVANWLARYHRIAKPRTTRRTRTASAN